MAHNSTKSGVDTMDYITENYTVALPGQEHVDHG